MVGISAAQKQIALRGFSFLMMCVRSSRHAVLHQGMLLFLLQFTGVAAPSIYAGFRQAIMGNPNEIKYLLTTLGARRSRAAVAGKGGELPNSRMRP